MYLQILLLVSGNYNVDEVNMEIYNTPQDLKKEKNVCIYQIHFFVSEIKMEIKMEGN